MTMKNPLVSFLRAYGPSATSSSLFDEFVVKAAADSQCKPLSINQPLVGKIVDTYQAGSDRSVVLTGTAGDGKTYTARKVLEELSEGSSWWRNNDKTYEFQYKNLSLVFIKDLSELKESDKDDLYPDLWKSLLGYPSARTYVICGNDGHLLKMFRDRRDYNQYGEELYQHFQNSLLHPEKVRSYDLYNMSRHSNDKLIDSIFSQVTDHEGWEDCKSCPLYANADTPCPIRVNLDLLRHSGEYSLRRRVKDMVRLASANDNHLSVRQIIMLVVNALLGDQQGQSDPMLTCRRALNRAKDEAYAATSPFVNIFGFNLAERERKQYGAFAVLSEFGVGDEASRTVDSQLMLGGAKFVDHQQYGQRIFNAFRENCNQASGEAWQQMPNAMANQRRRVFFLGFREYDSFDIWQLSKYKHSRLYLGLLEDLEHMEGKQVEDSTIRCLVLGINRLMTGNMTDEDRAIWLCEPWGSFNGPETPFFLAKFVSRGGLEPGIFRIARSEGGANCAPELVLYHGGVNEANRIGSLKLTATLFEFIVNVSEGMLPQAMANYCAQEVRKFQLKSAQRLKDGIGSDTTILQEIRIRERDVEPAYIDILGY